MTMNLVILTMRINNHRSIPCQPHTKHIILNLNILSLEVHLLRQEAFILHWHEPLQS